MIGQSGWLTKVLPPPEENIGSGAGLDKGYKRFSRGLSLILFVLVLIPLSSISFLSHYQYQQLIKQEELDELVLNLEEVTSTIEEFILELKSVIKFVARDDRYEELLDPKELAALFVRLQSEYPAFVDIEIIDSQGLQKSYFGPYHLESYKYTDEVWYKEVLQRGVYVSKVFSGFRNVPHFVIAVCRKHPQQPGNWILRVTIDAITLQNFINTIDSGYADDLFLVDLDSIAQTAPQKYGEFGERCLLYDKKDSLEEDHPGNKSSGHGAIVLKSPGLVVYKKTFRGQQINHAVADLLDTPWKLVLVKEQYFYADEWLLFKIRLITIFISCSIVAVFVILEISDALTAHIRESDKKRQQLYSEAEHSNKLASIGRLAAGVAHEINNPLSIINQKAGLVQDFIEMSEGLVHKQVMSEALEGVQNSVERCKTITHRLLGFARQTDVHTEEIDVNSVVREVVDFLAKEATYNQIQIDFKLDYDINKIWSDRGPLQQILLNITNNAIDAIGSKGKIILGSRQIDPNTIQVYISDNGPGMSPEVRQNIFEPFFTTKETGKGTGLGLSITYGLVKKLGGNINVLSERGMGTTFEITFPVKQGE